VLDDDRGEEVYRGSVSKVEKIAAVFWMPRVGVQEIVVLTKCRASGSKTRAFSSVVLVEG